MRVVREGREEGRESVAPLLCYCNALVVVLLLASYSYFIQMQNEREQLPDTREASCTPQLRVGAAPSVCCIRWDGYGYGSARRGTNVHQCTPMSGIISSTGCEASGNSIVMDNYPPIGSCSSLSLSASGCARSVDNNNNKKV